ncbi:6-aminohexanoate-dimer hydrolase [Roseovarius tolerans]|uniref:6-aminohexanoate-dimer hydrolase n=1 Tax=Roseovarius tolerans TaxID=74031 RepID=A0A0L6CVV1_9RHOB|nr:serine hydrolase [Roseovarius tolerans]KNX41805.1 6-aminohexanoate-dimer hydrolase [Roseovarius tolerans]
MRAIVKWTIRIMLALVLALVVVGLWKREEITRLWAVNTLFDDTRIVANFSNMERAFLTLPVPRGDGPVSPLPQGSEMSLPEGVATWIEARNVTSLLVLHDGRIVHERYLHGTQAEDRRISWSVAKSFLSALFGIALAEGQIASLDDPVTRYAPQLQGSAYDGTTIRQLLQMTSGLEFDEDYLNYDSDINRMGRVLALGGTMDGFAAGLTARAADPGTRWKYVSIDTHALAMVLRGATGRDLPGLLSEHIIQPLGFQAEPYYLSDGEGVAFALGGLNLTTRDYARFGLMVEQMGRYQGRQVVPEDWIRASTTPSAPTPEGALKYGYQWWMPQDARDGEVFGHGIYGQYIYIDRARDAVIVVTSADRGFREPGVKTGNIAMLRRIAAAL